MMYDYFHVVCFSPVYEFFKDKGYISFIMVSSVPSTGNDKDGAQNSME